MNKRGKENIIKKTDTSSVEGRRATDKLEVETECRNLPPIRRTARRTANFAFSEMAKEIRRSKINTKDCLEFIWFDTIVI